MGTEPVEGVDEDLDDLFRRGGGGFFYLNSALRGGYGYVTATGAVQGYAKVKFLAYGKLFLHQNALNS